MYREKKKIEVESLAIILYRKESHFLYLRFEIISENSTGEYLLRSMLASQNHRGFVD